MRDNFWWDSIEPTAGNYTFSTQLNDLVNDATTLGLEVLPILGEATPAYTFPGGLPTATIDAAFANYAVACGVGRILDTSCYTHGYRITSLLEFGEMERVTRFERATSSLARKCSTTELHPLYCAIAALAALAV